MSTCLSIILAVSTHIGLAGDYNEVHPSVRCTVDNTIYGVYYNSESNESIYLGKKYGNWEVGLVSGYTSMTVAPMIRYINNGFFITPAYETGGTVGVALGYEISFDI